MRKNRKDKIAHLIKTEVELQAIVPVKALKKIGEHGLREVVIKQNTEFGLERHFDKEKIDRSKIDITFGFGKLTIKAKDLKEALEKATICSKGHYSLKA